MTAVTIKIILKNQTRTKLKKEPTPFLESGTDVICTIVTASKEKEEEIREDTMQDSILQQVKQYILKG